MSGFDVVPCRTCHTPWLVESDARRQQATITCPHCGTDANTDRIRVLAHHETKAGAAELRARILADRSGEGDRYAATDDYAQMADEVDARLDAATPGTAGIDLTPIGTEWFADAAEDHLDYRDRRFEAEAEQASGLFEDAFADAIADDDGLRRVYWEDVRPDVEDWAAPPAREDIPRGEVTATDQQQASAAVEIDLAATTVTDLWDELFATTALQTAFADAVRGLCEGMTADESYAFLEERGVPFWLRSAIVDAARGSNRSAWHAGVDLAPTLPDGPATVEHLLATASLFEAIDDRVTVVARVRETFLDADTNRRDQRVDVCDLLARLATGLDVRVVASGRLLRQLADTHRADLPGISEWCNRRRGQTRIDERVEVATAGLNPDGRKVAVLRQLADEPGGILSRHAIEAMHDVDSSRISQILTNEEDSLTDLGLVDIYGHAGDQKVELLDAGQRVIETFDTEIGRQSRLPGEFSGTGKSSPQCRVTPRVGRGTEEASPAAAGRQPFRTRYANRATHVAAMACSDRSDVGFVRGAIPDADESDRKTRLVSYNPDRDEAVVAVRASEPLPWASSTAVALASPKFLNRALPNDRLEGIDEAIEVLRGARNIGCLSDEAVNDPQTLREDLIEWGERIEEMTTKLKHGEYDDRDAFRSEILSSAQGLAGSIVHLLDAAGTEIVREVRVPGGVDKEKLRDLAKSIAISIAIQSRYGGYAPYRQLFDVPNADQPRVSPDVDAADPVGRPIGSVVVRGPDVHRLRSPLGRYLESPRELLEDAPEFAIRLDVAEVGRDAFEDVLSRIGWQKSLRPTSEAVSLLHGLVATPHDAARVLHRRLEPETRVREIRPDEIRTALAGLEPEALLPGLVPSAGKILAALLSATDPLSQTELAERADVSTRTVRNHQETLQALGVLQIDEDGYRLALSFSERSERQSPVVPDAVDDGTLLDVLGDLLAATLPPGRYGDPADPVGGALFWPPDLEPLLAVDDLAGWVELALRLTGAAESDHSTVAMGPAIEQRPIQATASSEGVVG